MLRIRWTPPSGEEEHEEDWSGVPAFLTWADREGLHGRYSAYEPDEEEEGEWLLVDSGSF